MTRTNRLPAIEALGEALAALEGKREAFREGSDDDSYPPSPAERTFRAFTKDASQAMQHLANSGWVLTPGPVVNAGEERTPVDFYGDLRRAVRQRNPKP